MNRPVLLLIARGSGQSAAPRHPVGASTAPRALPAAKRRRCQTPHEASVRRPIASMKHIYLDQNQWSYLSLAAEAVTRSAADGTASFPLSTAHVFETWKQHRADKRQPLAQTMMEISRNDAIASPQQLLPPELDQALHRRFGRPDPPAQVEPFGRGLQHLSPADSLRTPIPSSCAICASFILTSPTRRSPTASTRSCSRAPMRTSPPPRSASPICSSRTGLPPLRPNCRSSSGRKARARMRSAALSQSTCCWTSRRRWRLRPGGRP